MNYPKPNILQVQAPRPNTPVYLTVPEYRHAVPFVSAPSGSSYQSGGWGLDTMRAHRVQEYVDILNSISSDNEPATERHNEQEAPASVYSITVQNANTSSVLANLFAPIHRTAVNFGNPNGIFIANNDPGRTYNHILADLENSQFNLHIGSIIISVISGGTNWVYNNLLIWQKLGPDTAQHQRLAIAITKSPSQIQSDVVEIDLTQNPLPWCLNTGLQLKIPASTDIAILLFPMPQNGPVQRHLPIPIPTYVDLMR